MNDNTIREIFEEVFEAHQVRARAEAEAEASEMVRALKARIKALEDMMGYLYHAETKLRHAGFNTEDLRNALNKLEELG